MTPDWCVIPRLALNVTDSFPNIARAQPQPILITTILLVLSHNMKGQASLKVSQMITWPAVMETDTRDHQTPPAVLGFECSTSCFSSPALSWRGASAARLLLDYCQRRPSHEININLKKKKNPEFLSSWSFGSCGSEFQLNWDCPTCPHCQWTISHLNTSRPIIREQLLVLICEEDSSGWENRVRDVTLKEVNLQ